MHRGRMAKLMLCWVHSSPYRHVTAEPALGHAGTNKRIDQGCGSLSKQRCMNMRPHPRPSEAGSGARLQGAQVACCGVSPPGWTLLVSGAPFHIPHSELLRFRASRSRRCRSNCSSTFAGLAGACSVPDKFCARAIIPGQNANTQAEPRLIRRFFTKKLCHIYFFRYYTAVPLTFCKANS